MNPNGRHHPPPVFFSTSYQFPMPAPKKPGDDTTTTVDPATDQSPQTTSTHTVSGLTTNAPATPGAKNTVSVAISYPKDYSGPRFQEEGATVEMSQEEAEHHVELGIGKIVE